MFAGVGAVGIDLEGRDGDAGHVDRNVGPCTGPLAYDDVERGDAIGQIDPVVHDAPPVEHEREIGGVIVDALAITSDLPPQRLGRWIEQNADWSPENLVPRVVELFARNHDTDWNRYVAVHHSRPFLSARRTRVVFRSKTKVYSRPEALVQPNFR